MGFWRNLKNSFNEGAQEARDEAARRRREKNVIPIELAEPNRKNFVTLKITEEDEFVKRLYLKQLISYARTLDKMTNDEMEVTVFKNGITLKLSSEQQAAEIRAWWQSSL